MSTMTTITGQTGLLVLSNTQLENSLEEEEETADVITDNAMENSGLGRLYRTPNDALIYLLIFNE